MAIGDGDGDGNGNGNAGRRHRWDFCRAV